jgi:hypothetical protein
MIPTDFMECEGCRAQPGMPPLCAACLNNRGLISDLREHVRVLQCALNGMLESWAAHDETVIAYDIGRKALEWKPKENER